MTNNIKSKKESEIKEVNWNTSLPYNYFLLQCNKYKHVAIIGKDFPQKLIDSISSHNWELDDFNENEFYKRFETVEEFEKYISSKDYGTDEKLNPKICFGISKTDKFKFGIHYDTINIENEDSNEFQDLLDLESPHIPNSKSNKNEKIRIQENLKNFDKYKTSGYLMTLKIIYDYIIKEVTEDENAEINFVVLGMKFDYILKDGFHRFLNGAHRRHRSYCATVHD